LDAYIFSTQATPQAVQALGGAVDPDGPIRVVLPVTGAHALFVAVVADTGTELSAGISGVIGATGLSGLSAYIASALGASFLLPVHAAVDAYVGFALLDTAPGTAVAVHDAAVAISGVTGAAVVVGATYDVLVEVTGATETAVASVLTAVTGLTDVTNSITSTGASDDGFGLTRI
jgi:hypothetical protein